MHWCSTVCGARVSVPLPPIVQGSGVLVIYEFSEQNVLWVLSGPPLSGSPLEFNKHLSYTQKHGCVSSTALETRAVLPRPPAPRGVHTQPCRHRTVGEPVCACQC